MIIEVIDEKAETATESLIEESDIASLCSILKVAENYKPRLIGSDYFDGPVLEMVVHELNGYVEKAFSMMTEKQVRVIRMRYGLGYNEGIQMNFSEIGREMEISRWGVELLHKRAIKNLRKYLEEKYKP